MIRAIVPSGKKAGSISARSQSEPAVPDRNATDRYHSVAVRNRGSPVGSKSVADLVASRAIGLRAEKDVLERTKRLTEVDTLGQTFMISPESGSETKEPSLAIALLVIVRLGKQASPDRFSRRSDTTAVP